MNTWLVTKEFIHIIKLQNVQQEFCAALCYSQCILGLKKLLISIIMTSIKLAFSFNVIVVNDQLENSMNIFQIFGGLEVRNAQFNVKRYLSPCLSC